MLNPQRKRTILPILTFVCALVFLAFSGFMGFLVHEGNRATQEFTKTRKPTRIVLDSRRPVAETRQTSPSLTGHSAGPLRFAPLITDAPDLPDKLRADKDRLNLEFDRILNRIAEYEKNKTGLKRNEADAVFEQVNVMLWKLVQETLDDLGVAHKRFCDVELAQLPKTGSTGQIREACYQVIWWRMDSMIEKAWDPIEAGIISQGRWRYRQQEWRLSKHGQPVSNMDFFRECGYDDYYRTLHYWRQAGGITGYKHILQIVVSHKLESFAERPKP
ncbi:hypothetical protein LLG95_15725 [bacterium]|nr:hypothetical protein [bacterium]